MILQLETPPEMSNTRRTKYLQEFYNRLARVIRALNTMGKAATEQVHSHAIFNKPGPVGKVLAQKDD